MTFIDTVNHCQGCQTRQSVIENLTHKLEVSEATNRTKTETILDMRDRIAVLENTLKDCLGSLVAATWLLENGGKKAAASDTIFKISLSDYNKSIERGRTALGASNG